MITPMQGVFAHLRASKESDGFGEAYCVDWLLEMEKEILEKEKERLCDAYIKGGDAQYQYIIEGSFPYNTAEDWYNETFKTKER